MTADWTIVSGTAHPELAAAIAASSASGSGREPSSGSPTARSPVRIDQPVRGREVFLVQPTSPPVDEHLIELLALADACRRSAAARITAVVPYFGYARSDKRHGRREPITASLVAQLMQAAGIDQVVTLDLHAAQIEGFFHIPVESLTAVPTLCRRCGAGCPPGRWSSRRIPGGSRWPPTTPTGSAPWSSSCTSGGPAAPRPR